MTEDDHGSPNETTGGKGVPVREQARQIWVVLVGFVMFDRYPAADPNAPPRLRRYMTYGELARLIGREGQQNTLGPALRIIGNYCVLNNLPPLNIVVVNKDTRRPGEKVVKREGRSVEDEMRAVAAFDWFALRPPTPAALEPIPHHGQESQDAGSTPRRASERRSDGPGWDAKAIHRIARDHFGGLQAMFEHHGWDERGSKMTSHVQRRVKETYGSIHAFVENFEE